MPWVHLAVNTTGNFRVCCNSTPGDNFILDENNKPYNISRSKIDDVWNSEVYKRIRKEMLRGKRPKMCVRCFREEDAGLRSARNNFNKAWMRHINKDVLKRDRQSTLNIKYFDLRLGNLCNSKCRMCNPYSSVSWCDDWKSINSEFPVSEIRRLKNIKWFKDVNIFNVLNNDLKNLREIYFTGGEPTLVTTHFELLEMYIKSGRAKNIRLKYNLNLTNLPDKLIDCWKYFKEVKINCSMDGYDKLNEYIRYPSDWYQIDHNFRKIINLKGINLKLGIHVTVQIYNIFGLTELFDYLKNFKIFPYLNILNHPEILNVRVLSKEQKEKAGNNIKVWFKKNRRYIDGRGGLENINKLNGIIDYMNKEDWSNLYPDFLIFTKKLDKIRNQDFKMTISELI